MSWELTPTPHPNEFAIRIWVAQGQVLNIAQLPVEGVTLLKDFELGTAPSSEGYGGYIYKSADSYSQGGDASGASRIAFNFVKVRTTEEIAAPFEEFMIEDAEFWWPQILEDFKIYCNSFSPSWFALSTDRQSYVFVVRKLVRPSYRGTTKIIVRRYWSHIPWEEAGLVSAPMQPNTIDYDLMVIRGSVKDCLHGITKVPGLDGPGGAEQLYDITAAVPAFTAVDSYPSRTYAATNYTTWTDHVYKATQRPMPLGYLKETYEAQAPPLTPLEAV